MAITEPRTVAEPGVAVSIQRTGVRIWLVVGLVLLAAWLALAIALSLTRGPWSNEAWSAIPAVNLAQNGTMGTTVLEFRNTWLHGLDRHTYWLMPLHILAQAVWYKILGFSLFKQRLLSVIFAVVLLVAWYRIVARLTGLQAAAISACVLIGFEVNFLSGAANGRMDMMCAALGSAAVAAWMDLSVVSPRMALLAGHSLAAAAVFTHPCGILFCAALLLISLAMNNWRVRLPDLLIAASPYLIAAAFWGMYIAQAPSDFRAQFFGNASGFAGEYSGRERFNGLMSPARAIVDEMRLRYGNAFGFDAIRTRVGALNAIRFLVLVSAAAATMLIPGLRRQRGVRILFGAAVLVFLMMALLEGMKYPHYVIYFLPFLSALAATTGAWLWNTHRKLGAPLAFVLLLLTLAQIKLLTNVIRLNPLRDEMGVVADYVRSHRNPGDLIVGGAELGYVLGFDDSLRDDVRLGYLTGARPRFVVTTGWYRLWFDAARTNDPGAYRYIDNLLAREYRPELALGQYRVYQRIEP